MVREAGKCREGWVGLRGGSSDLREETTPKVYEGPESMEVVVGVVSGVEADWGEVRHREERGIDTGTVLVFRVPAPRRTLLDAGTP